jgi:hypothetical protein
LQTWEDLSHADSQQTPLTQKPDRHGLPPGQASPRANGVNVGVCVGVLVAVGVCVGVFVGVGVTVAVFVTVGVFVLVGVAVLVGVFVTVGVGVGVSATALAGQRPLSASTSRVPLLLS